MSNKITWIKWLEDSRVGFNRSQASKYMKIAENFKGEMFTSSKHLTIYHLTSSTH